MTNTLMPIDQALEQLLSAMQPIQGNEDLLLQEACGRVLSQDIVAGMDVPPHASSAMDGYAVHSTDTGDAKKVLPITQRIPAGKVGTALAPGEVARIFTGAPVPPGADAVVMQENTETLGSAISILQEVSAGENLRQAGEDVLMGTTLFRQGHRLLPQDIGVLAATGLSDVLVRRRLKIALLTTGDEIVNPGEPLMPGQIYNANYYSLSRLLEALDVDVIDAGSAPDDFEETKKLLALVAQSADCVITTGGVSVGEEDHVRAVIEAIGQIDLWKLAIKPGKPFASGRIGKAHFFGLPGNSVSAFVTFVLLVRPALLALLGSKNLQPRSYLLDAGFELKRSGSRQEYLRVMIDEVDGRTVLQPYDNQSSGVTASLSYADGLAVVPPEASISLGDKLRYIPFSELIN